VKSKKKLITKFDLEESKAIVEKWSTVFPMIKNIDSITTLFTLTKTGMNIFTIDMEDSKIRDLIHDSFDGDKNKAIQYCINAYNREMQELRENLSEDIIKRCQDTLKLITRLTALRVPKRKPKPSHAKWGSSGFMKFKSPGVYTREVDTSKVVTGYYSDELAKTWSTPVGPTRGILPTTPELPTRKTKKTKA